MEVLLLAPTIRRALASSLPTATSSRLFSTTWPARSSNGPGRGRPRTYNGALRRLQSLQSNKSIRASIADAKPHEDPNRNALPEMREWARRAGYEPADLGKQGQRYIHVAGTKGKGSVCVMVENILLQLPQYRGAGDGEQDPGEDQGVGKIGLYTSPHLVTVRERIRINGAPISEELFTRYFYELWDRFERAAAEEVPESSALAGIEDTRPGYFRYLTLLALHTFIQEGVKTAVVECGIGGEYDSTNILPANAVAVSAITRLGIDHTPMLGETIKEIAWHKAGIMKKGTPAITLEQEPEALKVLIDRTIELGAGLLKVIPRLPAVERLKLGLLGEFQYDNASLAVAVAASYLQNNTEFSEGMDFVHKLREDDELPAQFRNGLETVSWPGRCQVINDDNIEWCIDGAHTTDSIEAVSHWFRSLLQGALVSTRPPTSTMLIFNQTERDGNALLRALFTSISRNGLHLHRGRNHPVDIVHLRVPIFRFAAFCTNEPFITAPGEHTDEQEKLARSYQMMDRNGLHMSYSSVEEAVGLARKISEGEEKVMVLVTGSLHLVGGLLQVLERDAARDG